MTFFVITHHLIRGKRKPWLPDPDWGLDLVLQTIEYTWIHEGDVVLDSSNQNRKPLTLNAMYNQMTQDCYNKKCWWPNAGCWKTEGTQQRAWRSRHWDRLHGFCRNLCQASFKNAKSRMTIQPKCNKGAEKQTEGWKNRKKWFNETRKGKWQQNKIKIQLKLFKGAGKPQKKKRKRKTLPEGAKVEKNSKKPQLHIQKEKSRKTRDPRGSKTQWVPISPKTSRHPRSNAKCK